ncbi:hypothetical protein [Paraburkholderia bryophila]|uniref:Uncharacterized protein n=1 Tax=Paraburkholderia bryophila TaxID=420952 RepID=A0A7Z0B5E4_9BURK|nr:hypothetical protein [Paraburkholderia bryophila]NYH22221.1 hypothetical protein [Paraburkholderia bryophila]
MLEPHPVGLITEPSMRANSRFNPTGTSRHGDDPNQANPAVSPPSASTPIRSAAIRQASQATRASRLLNFLPGGDLSTVPTNATSVEFNGQTIKLRPSRATPDTVPGQLSSVRTLDALNRPSSQSTGVTSSRLNQADLATNPRLHALGGGVPIPAGCLGCTLHIMRVAATAQQSGGLGSAAMWVGVRYQQGGAARQAVIDSIRRLQADNRLSGPGRDLPGYIRHPGSAGLRSGDELIADLTQHFATLFNPHREPFGHPETFVLVGLSLGNAPAGVFTETERPAHTLAIQRMHTTAEFRRDTYALYDPSYGAFQYENFSQLTYALQNYYPAAYPRVGGYTSANTTYYAMRNVLLHPRPGQRLGEPGGGYGIPALQLPLNDLTRGIVAPPPVDLLPSSSADPDRPGPSGYVPRPRDESQGSIDDSTTS